jgi:starvation-inducible DNA-binding protein
MKTNIGIKDVNLKSVAGQLAKLLADEYLLLTKTYNAHWNVEGADFHAAHLYFEGLYGEMQENIDSVAERIRALGHYAPATMTEFLELTQLSEKRKNGNTSLGYIKDLLGDHESVIVTLRGCIESFTKANDMGTSDFVTGLMEKHEKIAWMLRAHLS